MRSHLPSILVASRLRNDLVRLCTVSGFDSGFVSGHAQIEALMEHLAVVSLDSTAVFASGVAAVERGTGSVVAVIGGATQADVDALVAARARSGGLTLVQLVPVGAAGQLASIAPERARRARVRVVRVGRDDRLEDVWNQAMRGRRPSRPAVAP